MNEHVKLAERVHCLSAIETRLWVRAQQVSLQASVGIHRGEKSSRQEIVLSIAAEVSEPEADRIAETVDYRALVDEATSLSNEGHFELIETFICELGRRIAAHPQVHMVELELFKPAAIAPAMASVRYEVRKNAAGPRHLGWQLARG